MIDVKELRIGSHVSVGGVRKRIDHIGINGELGEIYIFNPEWTKERQSKERSEHTWFCTQIEPIPITAELLTELGFEKTNHVCVWRKPFNHSLLTISTHHKGEWACSLWQEGCRAVLNVRYLHELESFVYLTLHKELIEE